ncbi:hypothetical protein BT67DRAFT_262684 [Trichocladium antarcticum]|uniref:Uncharacterized protein n=1 Tax=Trichocladium antarcticum TaxID=1450529 RepID=A0AAN6UN46_9PEZI|nr:hypothetical protein BT67DRAFT_262684 [Trichocladium antarcticum]
MRSHHAPGTDTDKRCHFHHVVFSFRPRVFFFFGITSSSRTLSCVRLHITRAARRSTTWTQHLRAARHRAFRKAATGLQPPASGQPRHGRHSTATPCSLEPPAALIGRSSRKLPHSRSRSMLCTSRRGFLASWHRHQPHEPPSTLPSFTDVSREPAQGTSDFRLDSSPSPHEFPGA